MTEGDAAADQSPFDVEQTMRSLATSYIHVYLAWDENNRRFAAWVRYGRENERGYGRSAEDAFADLERNLQAGRERTDAPRRRRTSARR